MKRILVVEDSRLTFMLLQRELAGSDRYQVEYFCKNAENLLEVYEQHRPDVVLMDIVMDGANGIEETRMLTQAHPEAKVVILSSLAFHDVQDMAAEAGAVGYIHKPIRGEDVTRVLDQALMA